MSESKHPSDLTAPQRRFARENHADPGMHAAQHSDWVFMYHDEPFGTNRWLVDPDGHVMEKAFLGNVRTPTR